VAVLGGITTLAAAWKPITSAVEWWISRHDGAVLELLRGRENVARAMVGFVVPEATSVTFMASCLKRTPQSVQKSLLRLERRDRVHREIGGWQFGATPPRQQADLQRWK
jgi:predicted Rossmann fold nucleotide-binding protein DprA/Smf involved in DNA uptake